MNVPKVVSLLRKKYPGKQIIKNKNIHGKVVEILCEIEPTEDHPEYSRAIAVIDSSILHVHKKLTETYKVIKGELLVFMADDNISIKKGESHTMKPGEIHANLGNETWVGRHSSIQIVAGTLIGLVIDGSLQDKKTVPAKLQDLSVG